MKIRIIGPSGSGKTTLSREIEQFFRIERIGLDRIHSQKNRQSVLEELMQEHDNWVIEGVFIQSWCAKSIREADIVLFLNLPLRTSQFRVVKRSWERMYKSSPKSRVFQMRRAYRLLLWNQRYQKRLPRIKKRLFHLNKNVLILNTEEEVENFIDHLDSLEANTKKKKRTRKKRSNKS